ncbi:sensor histidine kinase [Sphingomonas morindae]|uniref:histidine kinase n=1 Tax=Sphingomonas morindae TaxID=1541170 RepID=A0ABY4X520_9SPHN|nr:HAMP domain-containing sensor histidine kinase [Sphingomonas morindae]USI71993.1 HAMP domain-containing histidine kinase [Sphingomonas morindae]
MIRDERLRWRDVRATTPFRLTLLLGALFLAGLWATLGFSYGLTAHELTLRSDRILHARARILLAVPAAALPRRIDAEIARATPGFSYFALQSRDGTLIAGNIRLISPQPPGRPFNLEARPGDHGPVRVLAVRAATGETIILGRDITQIRDLRRRLLFILVVSGLCGTLVILSAAIALSLPTLRRVRDLARASRLIAAGAFDQRMPIAGRHDELDQFAATVNHMVEEVGRVVAQVKTATDAIAHDLRTPLTRVRAALHRARAAAAPPGQGALLDPAIADLDHVIARFAALLRLSELEAAGRRSGLRPIDLAPLLAQLAELYAPLAEDRGVVLHSRVAPVPPIEADPALLFEAIANLVDNASKFARGAVTLRTRACAAMVLIEVIDDGPGIPPDEREAVLRRFHRARGAAGVEGSGLGLAVVGAIVHIHGFTLELADAAPGLVARIRAAPASAPEPAAT